MPRATEITGISSYSLYFSDKRESKNLARDASIHNRFNCTKPRVAQRKLAAEYGLTVQHVSLICCFMRFKYGRNEVTLEQME